VGVYTKSKTSELSPLRRKLLRFAKQFPPPLRSNKSVACEYLCTGKKLSVFVSGLCIGRNGCL
jgi:hypothetical protein